MVVNRVFIQGITWLAAAPCTCHRKRFAAGALSYTVGVVAAPAVAAYIGIDGNGSADGADVDAGVLGPSNEKLPAVAVIARLMVAIETMVTRVVLITNSSFGLACLWWLIAFIASFTFHRAVPFALDEKEVKITLRPAFRALVPGRWKVPGGVVPACTETSRLVRINWHELPHHPDRSSQESNYL